MQQALWLMTIPFEGAIYVKNNNYLIDDALGAYLIAPASDLGCGRILKNKPKGQTFQTKMTSQSKISHGFFLSGDLAMLNPPGFSDLPEYSEYDMSSCSLRNKGGKVCISPSDIGRIN